MTDEVTTAEFRIGHGKLLALMARRYAAGAAVAGGVLLAGSAILGIFIDLRWLIVCMMLVFLIAPAVAAMLYFNYGMRPECFVNILDHRVVFAKGELVVTAYIREPDEELPEEETAEAAEADAGEGEEVVVRREVIYRFINTRPASYRVGTKALTVFPAAPAKGFIHVPFDAFDDEESIARALGTLRDNK